MKKTNATFADILWRWNIGGEFIKKNHLSQKIFLGTVILLISNNLANAQLTATGQIRMRAEYRAGQGTLLPQGANPAIFNTQRTRLNIGYTGYRFKVYTAIQDVRVWGQDASTINQTTTQGLNGLMLHEAWGEIMFNDTGSLAKVENLSLKVGRQEIFYDDQKILGNLDWLQQARRHDAVILKYANKGWICDLGAAFNQNAIANANTYYNGTPPLVASATSNTITSAAAYPAGTNGIGTMYKSFQYAYLGKKFFFGNGSLLFFKDDFSKYTTVGSAKNYQSGVWSRMTAGAYIDATIKRRLNVIASYYHQGGQNKDGAFLNANLASISTSLLIGRKLYVGPGVDYLSGNNGTSLPTGSGSSRDQRFDPLYGTPHKFWGYMDYFYAANGFGQQGLLNYFFKIKYNAKDNLIFTLDAHAFAAANKVWDGKVGGTGTQKSYLGTELDFVVKYNITKMINIEAGYSIMEATSTMESAQVKNVKSAELTPQWAYLMINIKPNFMAK
jgi:hypothetical protein